MKRKKIFSPYFVIVMSFLTMILAGGFFLSLPLVTLDGKGTDLISGIFTATSSICVTGLTVNDVGTTYNIIGKTFIIVLIQLGGLGIITFSSLFVLLLSKKISHYNKKIIQEDINADTVFKIQDFIRKVVATVFMIEFIGAIFLFLEFIKMYSFKKAVYYALFHSISAFCNAGFALFPDSLITFKGSLIINIVIPLLIVLGGLGFGTMMNIYNYFRRKERRLSLTSRMAVLVTLFLTVIGAVLFYILESGNPETMGNYSVAQKIGAAIFQSITSRTAGFNTVSLTGMRNITVLFSLVLMFIGASPGSTGGGIKTTTVGLITIGVISTIRNNENIELWKRRISWNSFNRAVAILIFSLAYISIIHFLIILLEPRLKIIDISFEIFSAFGTVGLTRALTPSLGIIAKLLIIVTMFVGRVGPLTVMLSLSAKKIKTGKHKYPEENILIG